MRLAEGVACDGCGAISRLALAVAVSGAPEGSRFCWTCRRGWGEQAAARFVVQALRAFPGSVEVDPNGEPLPPEQLELSA